MLYLSPHRQTASRPIRPCRVQGVTENVTAMIDTGSATATKIRATGVDTKQLAFDLASTTLWARPQ